jgi:AcrR family transcriptional regulator
MAKAVKKRRYDSARRREQAAETRRDVLGAAQALFERDGYAATTVAAIASEAGVVPRTVYLAFETKAGLLRALWNLLLRGDDEEASVMQRQIYREVLEEPDPAEKLRLNARNALAAKRRMGRLLGVIRDAAPGDREIGGLWDRIQSEFHTNQRAIVDTLAAQGALREGLGAEEAGDILWALNHPDVWLLLVDRRGWSPERWEEWFSEASRAQLLGEKQ